MEENVFQAALAGLLLDIGEFARRAAETGNVLGEIIPGQWYSAIYETRDSPQLQPHLDQTVNRAVRLAAGGRLLEQGRQPEHLRSIFCSIELRDEQQTVIPSPQDKYLPLKQLAIRSDTIFPVDTVTDTQESYKGLWQGFLAEARILKQAHENNAADPSSYLSSLLKLMQGYCWSIPSPAYQAQADVSLYDHSRMTSALAACLASMPNTQNNQDKSVLLVGGDISGVQKFIYTITSRGATSGLRGRSMYLQLLTEVTARYVLSEIHMPLSNLIYAGGGHFYLLAPAGSDDDLKRAQAQISRILLYHHQGDLFLALAWETIQANEFQGKALSEKWREVSQKLQVAKQRQFAELGEEMASLLFQPQEHGGNEETLCAVCQREHPQTELVDETRKCPVCLGFEQLGKDLRQARYLGLNEIKAVPLPDKVPVPGDWQTILAHFGYRISVSRDLPPISGGVIRRIVLALEDGVLDTVKPTAKQAVGRHFLVNVTPGLTYEEYSEYKSQGVEDLPKRFDLNDPPLKTFEVMALQAQGIKRLGILRMDVDSLGSIFSTGLGERATLSRIAALSFAMSLYFEGWVEYIAESFNREERRDLIYSIYSGGDDLFFVGAWHLMPFLAEKINQDLAQYTGHHPGIHVSGGIALIDGKYPLYQAAEDAHEAEQEAKANVQPNGATKNALNFLGKTIPWGDAFETVKTKQKELVELVQPVNGQSPTPRQLLQRLNQLYVEYRDAADKRAKKGQAAKVYWGPWHWHAAYSLTRLARQNKQAETEILAIRDELSLDNFTNIEWLGLAARWAELLVR